MILKKQTEVDIKDYYRQTLFAAEEVKTVWNN